MRRVTPPKSSPEGRTFRKALIINVFDTPSPLGRAGVGFAKVWLRINPKRTKNYYKKHTNFCFCKEKTHIFVKKQNFYEKKYI
jgi:hypothetical protein